MYFDHCESPTELRKTIGEVLTGTTFVRSTFSGPGAQAITMIGPSEDQILRQAHLEARSVAERLRKRCPTLPALPDAQCLPLEGLCRIGAWCDEAAAKCIQAEQSPKARELAGEVLSEESDDLYGGLDTLRGDIYELCNTAFDAATETANFVLEEIYEDTEYETCVKIDEDLTATVTQYEKDAYAAAVSQHERGEIPWARRWDLSKWEVCKHMEPVLVPILEDFVAKTKGVLGITLHSRASLGNASELVGILQLTYDKGAYILSSFKEWENNRAEPVALAVESFRDYLSFLAERVILRLEEFAAQAKALGPVSLRQSENADKSRDSERVGQNARSRGDMDLIERVRIYVRRTNHREELRAAFDEARHEHPAILDWLEPYFHQMTKQVGHMKDAILPRSLSGAERLLLCRVLVTIFHDWSTGPDEEKIAVDPFACTEATPGQLAGAFGKAVCRVGRALPDNGDWMKKAADALADLEERERETNELTRADEMPGYVAAELKTVETPRQTADIPGLIKKLKALHSALYGGNKELIHQAKTDLKTYVGSVERMENLLREFQSRCGSDAYKNKHIDVAIGRAADLRAGRVLPYDWFWDQEVATEGVIGELERGLRQQIDATHREACFFRRKGAIWEICLDGQETTIKDSKGIQYIRYLLAHRKVLKEALEIERACNNKTRSNRPQADESMSFEDGLHVGEMDLSELDKRNFSLTTVRAQKTVWEGQLEQETDPSEQANLREKIEQVAKYISSYKDIHGKTRPTGPLESARKRVSNNINRAKICLLKVNEDIGRHFGAFVKPCGTAFVYETDREIDWSP